MAQTGHLMRRFLLVTTVVSALAGNVVADDLTELHCRAPFGPKSDAPDYRKYAPDREVDILHLALDITPDFKQRTIAGKAVIKFKPLGKPLQEVKLDAVDLTIKLVTSGDAIRGWNSTDTNLTVTFEKPLEVGKETTLHISYHAQPNAGLYFRTPEMGYLPDETEVWTQGEAEDSRKWYPNYDYPNEKFSSEIICRVPEGMIVLSNGKLLSREKDANGLLAFHWKQEKPHVNYLVTIAAGYFKKLEDKYRDLALEFHVPPSEIDVAKNSFATTKDTFEMLEKEIGVPYPWEKYYQVVVRDFVAGGMENTSITILTDRTLFPDEFENIRSSEGLVAHELAHQWFGDLVTCKDWSHLWLNEGFATYYALLYDEHKNGRDSMLYGLWQTRNYIVGQTNAPRPMVSYKYGDADGQFGYLAYQKGAWILQMLRSQLGKDLYRQCIKTFLERRAYESVVTEDLNKVIEELSGRSFDPFFDQWVFHAHHPELDCEYSWDEKTGTAKVSVKQSQKISDEILTFKFPLKVRFKVGGASIDAGKKAKETTPVTYIDREVMVTDKESDYYFSLPEKPKFVVLDPESALLAKFTFKPPTELLYATLEEKGNVVAKFFALERLAEKKDRDTVAKIKEVLNKDPFYGVRVEAAKALQTIHNEEALEALIASQKQTDARVRRQVITSMGTFYQAETFPVLKAALESEKNPDIVAQTLRALSAFPRPEVKDILLRYISTKSFRNVLADAAISAMRAQDDPIYIPALQTTLQKSEAAFTSRGFSAGLDALGYLARNDEKKEGILNFLLGYLTHKKKAIQLGAITALGTLEDPRAVSALETFTTARKDSPERSTAEKAIASIRAAQKPTDNLNELRTELLDLKKSQKETQKELDALKKKLEAQNTKPGKPARK